MKSASEPLPAEHRFQLKQRIGRLESDLRAAAESHASLERAVVRFREWGGRLQGEMEHQALIAMNLRELIREAIADMEGRQDYGQLYRKLEAAISEGAK
jgi:hypothetical protein